MYTPDRFDSRQKQCLAGKMSVSMRRASSVLLMIVATHGIRVRAPPRFDVSRRAAVSGSAAALISQGFLTPSCTGCHAIVQPRCVSAPNGRQQAICDRWHGAYLRGVFCACSICHPIRQAGHSDGRAGRMRANQLMRRAKARKNGELVKVDSTAAAAAAGQLSRGAAFKSRSRIRASRSAASSWRRSIEAQLLNATVLLGDRDINITIERVKEAEAEVRRLRAEGHLSRGSEGGGRPGAEQLLRRRTEREELTADGVADEGRLDAARMPERWRRTCSGPRRRSTRR